MLTNQDIIYCSNDWHADNRTSAHHIVRKLYQNNRVLYVEASGLRAPNATSHDLKRIVKKVFQFLRGSKKINGNLYIFSPILIPYHKYTIIQKLNKQLLTWSIKRQCKKLKFHRPLLWLIIPHMVMLVGKLQTQGVIYYCVDDFAAMPGVASNTIRQFDHQLTMLADVIFTPSEALYNNKKAINPNVFLSPHGVDMDHFAQVFQKNLPIPADIRTIGTPIIGFFGLIAAWIDLALIKTIALQHPDWSIVLIGRVVVDISKYKAINNIHFLKQKPFELLPNYAKRFDVAIIPYILNQQVMHANPIKLKEYLAMGKPVVAVRTPEIERFAHVLEIADNASEFIEKIELTLKTDSLSKRQQRINSLQGYTWQERFNDISQRVQAIVVNKTFK